MGVHPSPPHGAAPVGKCSRVRGWGFSCIFRYGDEPLGRASFSGFGLRDRVSFLKALAPWQGQYLLFSTLRGLYTPFALCKCDSNRLDSNIFSFFDRLLQSSFTEHNVVLGNSRAAYLEENFTPGQGIIFRNLTPGQGGFLDFLAAPHPYVRRPSHQVPPPQVD